MAPSSTPEVTAFAQPAATARAERRSFVVNTVFKGLSVPIEKAGRFVLMLVAAPALGRAAFGGYQFATTVTMLLLLCTELGLSVWTTRELARDRTRAPRVVGTALGLRALGVGPYLLAVTLAAVIVGPGGTRTAMLLLGPTAVLNAFVDYSGAVFRGHDRLRDEAWLNVVRTALLVSTGLAALHLHASIRTLCLGLLAGTSASAVYAFSVLHRRYGLFRRTRERFGFDRAMARTAATQGFQLWLATLLSLLYFRGDVILLRTFSGDAEVGAYSAAYKILDAVAILPGVVIAAAFPALVRAHADRERQRRWERGIATLLVTSGCLAGALLYFLGGRLVVLLYGLDYLRAVPSLVVLALAVPVLFLNVGLTHFLVARGLESRNVLVAGLMLLVNVGTNLVLIPRMGGPGAAWVTLITELALTVSCVAVLRLTSRATGQQSQATHEIGL